jgi:hypothetical protein
MKNKQKEWHHATKHLHLNDTGGKFAAGVNDTGGKLPLVKRK